MESKLATKSTPSTGGGGNGQLDPAMVAMLDQLDEHDERATQDRRREIRLPYRRMGLRLRVTHPGGGTADREVIGRDLCAHGAAVLYEGFLHPGTKFQLTLNRRLGGQDQVRGKIRYCKHVHSAYHMVGMQFDEPIAPKLYVDPSVWADSAKDVAIDAANLKGQVVVLDDQPTDLAVVTHFLRKSAVIVKGAKSSTESLAEIRENRVDAVLTEMNFDNGERGEQIIVKLREAGFRGPMIVATSESNAERIAGAWAAGATAILTKPYTRERLLSALATSLTQSDTESGGDALYSSLFDQTGVSAKELTDFIVPYVELVKAMIAKFEQAIAEDDIQKLGRICQVLKGNGESYGFSRVTELAKTASATLDSSGSIDESMSELRALQGACARLNATPRPTS